MIPPWNPGWVTGYVPPAGEWNGAFSAKVDFPVPLDQAQEIAQMVNASQGQLPSGSVILTVGTTNGIQTLAGPFVGTLPPLAQVNPGGYIILYDADYNANVNPINVVATPPDQIALYDTAAPSISINIADVYILIAAGATTWRAIVRTA